MNLLNLTAADLRRAAALADQITALQTALAGILGTPSAGPTRKLRAWTAARRRKFLATIRRKRARSNGHGATHWPGSARRKLSLIAKRRWRARRAAGFATL